MQGSSAASSQKSVQLPDIKKAIQPPVVTFTLFPYFSLIQMGFHYSRVFNYIPIIWIIAQHLVLSVFTCEFQNSKIDEKVSEIFLFTSLKLGTTFETMAGIIIFVCFFCSIFIYSTILFYKIRQTLPRFAIVFVSFSSHVIIPLIYLPVSFILGESIALYIEEGKSFLIAYIAFSFIAYVFASLNIYLTTTSASHTVFFNDTPALYYDSHVVFYSLLFNSFIAILEWLSQFFGNGFDALMSIIQIIIAIYMTVKMFDLPFAGVVTNSYICAAFIGQIGGCLMYLSGYEKFEPLRIIVAVVLYLICVPSFYFIFSCHSRRIINEETFTTPKNAIRRLRVAVSASAPCFLNGKLVEMITSNCNDSVVRLEVAKFVCFFHEFQPQFTAQLAMLRSATNLSLGDQFLLAQLKIAENSRQPLAAVDELIPLRDQTKSIEMAIRAAWKYMELNNDFSAYGIVESINVQLLHCSSKWKDAISKYPKNALLAEEYAHFLVECMSDFEGAAEWHYKAIQLQDGKEFCYDTATIHFLHVFPEYANKVINTTQLSLIDDADVKEKEDALGQLIEKPRMRLEYQRAISEHVSPVLTWIYAIGGVRFIALFVFWVCIAVTFPSSYEICVTNMNLVKNVTDVGEKTAVIMTEFILEVAKLQGNLLSASEMDEVVGNDDIEHTTCLINDSIDYLVSASSESYSGISGIHSFTNSIISAIDDGKDMDLPLDYLFTLDIIPYFYYNTSFYAASLCNVSFLHTISNFFLLSKQISGLGASMMTSAIPYEAFAGATTIIDNIYNLAEKFIDNKVIMQSNVKKEYIGMAITIVYAVLFVVVSSVFLVLLRINVKNTISACKLFPSEVFEKISSNIFIADISTDAPKYTTQVSKTSQSSTKSVVLGSLEALLTIVAIVFMALYCISISELNSDFDKMSNTLLHASKRECSAIEAFYSVMCANVLGGILETSFSSQYASRAEKAVLTYSDSHQYCATGYYGEKYQNEINSLRSEDKCTYNVTDEHKRYSCVCLDTAVPIYVDMMSKLIVQVFDNSFISSSDFINTYHFLNYHLYDQMDQIVEYTLKAGEAKSSNADTEMIVLSILGICISLVVFGVTIYQGFFLLMNYKTLLRLILRASPIDAVANDDLMRILLNRKTCKTTAKMSNTGMIVNHSNHPTVFTTDDGVIISVNTSFLIVFNYEASHIIGQSISQIADIDELQKAYEVAKSKEEIESTTLDKLQINWKKESGQPISCDALPVVVGKPDERLVCFILTDMTSFLSKKKHSDELKKENDELIALMFPKLLNGKEEMHLQDATLCAIKLVQFGTTLAPTELMKQRETILAKMQEIIDKYKQIEPLGFVQGMYITVSNTPGAAIIFLNCIHDILSSFDDSEFFGEITIGLDTGSPVDVFLIGGDSKHYVITGKPMTNVSRLCRIGDPGHACVTESVYGQIFGIKGKFDEKHDDIIGKYYSVEQNEDDQQNA